MMYKQRLRDWLAEAAPADSLERRQVVLLQLMLIVLLAGSVLSLPVNVLLPGPLPLRLLLLTAHLLVIGLSLVALIVVRRGRTALAALLASLGLVVGLTAVIVVSGMRNSVVPMFALALPLTITSLLASRRALSLLATMIGLAIGGVVILESWNPPLAGFLPPPGLPLPFIAVTFAVILMVLSLFLERFGASLRRAVRDLTAANQSLEAELARRKQLEGELLRVQRIESIGLLAGGIAHDFNNLLTAITAYTEFAIDGLEADHPAHADLRETLRAAERATVLTRQLLAFARRQVLEPRVFDLNTLIGETERMLRRLIGEHIDLVLHLEPALWPVYADPGQIEQVIVNLVVNARDAMPDGGTLLIETHNETLSETYIDRRVGLAAGDYVLTIVSDTGIGMDADVQKRVFEPFFTTKEQGRGTGLGLATCYGIIGQHNGYIWFYSEPGHGTTFKIFLPRASGPVEQLARSSPSAPLPRGSETVLVVEDEEAVRALVVRLLRSLGYTVVEASNGTEALDLVAALPGSRADLVLTDLVMPRLGGRALVEQLRAAGMCGRALYTTGYTDNAALRAGQLDSGTALLQKPFTPGALARKVRELLDS